MGLWPNEKKKKKKIELCDLITLISTVFSAPHYYFVMNFMLLLRLITEITVFVFDTATVVFHSVTRKIHIHAFISVPFYYVDI